MRTIQVENHVYDFLELMAKNSGDTVSDVIWRLIKEAIKRHLPQPASTRGSSDPTSLKPRPPIIPAPLEEFLRSSEFLVHANHVQRFLAVLSWLHKQNPSEFAKVKGLRGSNRLYFAESEQDLEASGSSVNPKRVPNSPFWVVTNSPTQGKKQLLSKVMRVLGYDALAVRAAVEALH